MTDGSVVSCGVCAAPVRATAQVCPRCASPLLGARADLPLALAGCVPAGAASRVVAGLADAVLALTPLAAGAVVAVLVGGPGRAVPAVTGAVLTAALVVALVAAWVRTGRTPGLALTGGRAVDTVTGLPPRVAGGPARWVGDVVVVDVRAGRDPATTSVLGGGDAHLEAPPAVTHGYRAPTVPSPVVAADLAPAPAVPAPVPPAPPVVPPPVVPPPLDAAPVDPAPVDPAPVAPAPRPAAPARGARLRLDDGGSVTVTGTTLLGRNPAPAAGEPDADLLPLHDLSRSVSKTHARLRWDGRMLWVVDRGSTNGTVLEVRGSRTLLRAGHELVAPVGSRIVLGDRVLTVEGAQP
ncbi:FHA domain-containing protein [Cellulomonas oligotrophica]|uniref:FHA domain-containing protein n=1 Tax=Cellulomonas oligotrophica TaxID=931536 RepID=A0A7Y9FGM3_9CELL|nr:FHA domain-containing protein [Cellulomonas oligotrophica]NYD86879.1 hypothetical protein [Cellulomonas oligotrophica]GIG32335.1 hypothetical protein Col01nite_14940 [Cellulomonas oligotrophica]